MLLPVSLPLRFDQGEGIPPPRAPAGGGEEDEGEDEEEEEEEEDDDAASFVSPSMVLIHRTVAAG